MDKDALIKEMHATLSDALISVRPELHLTSKGMFGGAGFFADDRIFAAWFGKTIALKLPEDAAEAMIASGDGQRAETRQYVEISDELNHNPERLIPWVARSIEYVFSQPVKARKKRKS